MATTTTNYGFDIPTSSDLVKNGATAIAELGQDIDTFLAGSPVTTAGKNAIINGNFDIWQRGTSSTSNGTYNTADRWWNYTNLGTTTWSRESTIVPTGSLYSMKSTQSVATATNWQMNQAIETLNAVQFAGKTVTVSAQFCASASTTVFLSISYSTSTDVAPTGSWTGISATSGTTSATSATTASFTQLQAQYAIPSTAKSILVAIVSSSVASGTSIYVGKVQLEQGSKMTQFSRAGGTIQGELAACQRYYWRATPAITNFGVAYATNGAQLQVNNPVPMRVKGSSVDYSGLSLADTVNTLTTVSSLSINSGSTPEFSLFLAAGNTPVALTQFRSYYLSGTYLGVSAEL
jgi:hypothetical protein